MSNTIITSAGAQAATSAAPGGPYFAIKYFVPVYDERIDATIHTTSAGQQASVLAISASMSEADTVPTGEIIFNILDEVSYEISEAEVLYTTSGEVTAASGADILVSGSDKNDTTVYNYIDNITDPLSPVITGSNFVPPATSGGNWLVTDYGLLSSAASATPSLLSDVDNMFAVSSYTPISSGANIRGMFKCRMNENVGEFKFNKIALYIVKVDSAGDIVTSASPTLFAISALETTIHKTTTGFNISNVEIDVELEFSIAAELSNLMFSTNDHWWSVPGTSGLDQAIFTDKDTAIGSSGLSWYPHAKLQVTDATKPQQRLAYDASNASDVFITSAGQRRTTTSGAGSSFGKDDNLATGEYSFTTGNGCSALGNNSLAGGYKSETLVSSENCFAYGYECSAADADMGNNYAIALGESCYARRGISIGENCNANGSNIGESFAIGVECSATQQKFAMGRKINVTGNYSTGIGLHTTTVQTLSGSNTFGVLGGGAIFGFGTNLASTVGSIAAGSACAATGATSFAFGNGAIANSTRSFAFGLNTSATGDNSFAFGNSTLSTASESFAFGTGAQATGTYSFAFGFNPRATHANTFALGLSSSATNTEAIAIGSYCNASNTYSFAMGWGSMSDAAWGYSYGYLCSATGTKSVAAGFASKASGAGSLAFGNNAEATGAMSFAIQLSGSTPIPVTAANTLGIVGGNVWHREYTRLGPYASLGVPVHPEIRVAKYIDTMPIVGSTIGFTHNLNSTKIISISCLAQLSGDVNSWISPNDSAIARLFYVDAFDVSSISITTGVSATSIAGQPLKCVVIYEE